MIEQLKEDSLNNKTTLIIHAMSVYGSTFFYLNGNFLYSSSHESFLRFLKKKLYASQQWFLMAEKTHRVYVVCFIAEVSQNYLRLFQVAEKNSCKSLYNFCRFNIKLVFITTLGSTNII